MKRTKRIAIVLRMSGTAGRDILSGIFHFTRQGANWHTRLFQMPDEFTPEAFQTEMAVGLDGIIASEPGPDETRRSVRIGAAARCGVSCRSLWWGGGMPAAREEAVRYAFLPWLATAFILALRASWSPR